MIIELHAIQNFAPSNLNRDDTGSPKDCEFGGYRRARISSQCFKRAIREHFKSEELLSEAELAVRTKRVLKELTDRLEARGKSAPDARAVAELALGGVKLTIDPDDKTQYLLFLGRSEIERVAGICLDYWEELSAAARAPADEGTSRRGAKDAKKGAREAVPAAVRSAMLQSLDGGQAADLALFGRMIADNPDKNIDAASQVAHALSTHKTSIEFDFYTAVDDLKPDDTAGADMLGTVEFNSACFYRYANVDLAQLADNLGDDAERASRTLAAFIRAFIGAIPTGKQNSMAAQNPPSFVLAVARERGLWSLANAFVKPIRPDENAGLVERSILALDGYWGRLTRVYGTRGHLGAWACALDEAPLTNLAAAAVDSVDTLVEGVLKVASFAPTRGNGG